MQKLHLKAPSKTIDKTLIENSNNQSATLVYVLVGIIICLVIIILAILLSPNSTPSSLSEIKIAEIKTVNNESIKITPEKPIQKKINSEEKFNEKIEIDWMLKKVDAENNKMEIWSKNSYEKALDFEQSAIKNKLENDYINSEKNYIKAIEVIDKTLLNKEATLNQHILEGTHFFDEENLDKAKQSFVKSQEIDDKNLTVIKYLERIRNRLEVISLYEQALEQEKNNEIDEAIKSLNKALILDPEYNKINTKILEIEAEKSKFEFNKGISEILIALDNNDLKTAKHKIQWVRGLNYKDPIIEELEIKFKEKNKIIKIKNLQRVAKIQESNEQWEKAKITYTNILKIDPDENNALVGQIRVKKYILLNQLINGIIQKPDRLQNDKVFEKSKNALAFVKNEVNNKKTLYYPNSQTPQLSKKIKQTEKIINDFSELISLTIKSDNETDVIIYKVAKLGKIKEKIIQLRPGKYTIVGSKMGYRDYRKIIHVTASDQNIMINVLCREKI